MAVKLTDPFAKRIRNTLRDGLKQVGITNAKILVEPVTGTKLFRVMVIARAFKTMGASERQEVTWKFLDRALTKDETLRISMILTVTPDDIGRD